MKQIKIVKTMKTITKTNKQQNKLKPKPKQLTILKPNRNLLKTLKHVKPLQQQLNNNKSK